MTISIKFWFVAATMRMSTFFHFTAADGNELFVLDYLEKLCLQREGISPISSRKTVPPSADSINPRFPVLFAPVNAPF
ncbi:hypothetical protein RCO48_37990 [Peribacillus frigoritolerans]|nr:hypothetical protein [Peribacillus frigoritolerans]